MPHYSTMNRFAFCFLIFSTNLAFGQLDFQTRLGGFMLGQYRDCPLNQLGKPIIAEKYDDGFEYEVFILRPDSSLYMIFEYSPADLNVIWSIQISGTNHNPNFLNLNLGMTNDELTKTIGKEPSGQENIGEYGTKVVYDSSNYSFEINRQGQLSSIKLINESYKYYTGPNKVERIPNFNQIQKTLTSNDNLIISSILAPDIEVYLNDSTYSFSKSFDQEIQTDYSGIFDLIKNSSTSLSNISPGDTTAYEENIRVSLGQNPMHVIKFANEHQIREIVFKYQFDRYLLWEYSIKEN